MALKEISKPDTIYMHQSMKEEDKEIFKNAIQKEWDDQYKNNNFSTIKKDKVPEGANIPLAVWKMRRK